MILTSLYTICALYYINMCIVSTYLSPYAPVMYHVLYINIYLSIYLSIYIYPCICTYSISLSLCIHTERYIYIHIHTYIYIYMYLYIYIYIYIYICDIPSYTPAVWFLGRVRLDCWPGPLPCPCWASKMPRGSCRWRWVVAVVPESCSLGPWGPKDSGLSWDIWVAEVTQIYGITIVNGIWGSFPSHF